MFTQKTSLIIPTKDRVESLIKLIRKFEILNLSFHETLIIDSSNIQNSKKIYDLTKQKRLRYFKTKPSTSYQRNLGLENINTNKFVMFIDDDVELFENTFEKMNECIAKYEDNEEIAGFCFNQISDQKNSTFEKLKSLKILGYLDFYPTKPGKVVQSGWHSKILNLKNDVLGDWMFTTMCIYKTKEINKIKFDETFGEYSYLEDLDFSLNLSNKGKKFFLSSEAKFKHPINIDRSSYKFGIIEVINRFKIVKKHNLSKKIFFIVLFFRAFFSFLKSLTFDMKYFKRGLGNFYALLLLIKGSFR